MTRQRLAAQILLALAYIVLNLLDALAHLAAIALLTVTLRLVLPLGPALGISILAVCTYSGYRTALRMEQARMRGEIR